MADTLTYGRVRPETGDAAAVWMPALEGNVTLDDAHDHDGTDSALLPASSINKTSFSSTVTSGQWSHDGGGTYSVLVTVPAAISGSAVFNDVIYYNLTVKINTVGATRGDVIYPDIERESATTFTLRVNDPALDLIIYYV